MIKQTNTNNSPWNRNVDGSWCENALHFRFLFFSRVWKYFSVVKFHYTSTTCRWQFTFLSFVSFLVIVCSLFVSSTEDGTLTKLHLPFHYVPRRRRLHCLRLFLIFAKISEIIKQIEDLQRKNYMTEWILDPAWCLTMLEQRYERRKKRQHWRHRVSLSILHSFLHFKFRLILNHLVLDAVAMDIVYELRWLAIFLICTLVCTGYFRNVQCMPYDTQPVTRQTRSNASRFLTFSLPSLFWFMLRCSLNVCVSDRICM